MTESHLSNKNILKQIEIPKIHPNVSHKDFHSPKKDYESAVYYIHGEELPAFAKKLFHAADKCHVWGFQCIYISNTRNLRKERNRTVHTTAIC